MVGGAITEYPGNPMRLMTLCVLALVSTSAMSYQDHEATGDAGIHDEGPASSIGELKKVARDYHAAMVHKDKAALLGFYYDDKTPVSGAMAPASFAMVTKASQGKATKVMSYDAKTASAGDTSPSATAEKMSHLVAQTDGTVASLQYDYTIPQGHGHTFWTLVRTKDAWKITSIVYSINLASLDKNSLDKK
jgi:hypothetical protein